MHQSAPLASTRIENALDSAATLAPADEGGLSIEALCASGKTLLIGFRNPILGGKALIVPLANPDAVVKDGMTPKLGNPIFLDLGGLGIRDMAWWRGQFLIIAGDYRKQGAVESKLFRWTGVPDDQPTLLSGDLKGWNPEAAVVYGDGDDAQLQILSDDGEKDGEGKDIGKAFRSFWLQLK